MSVKWLSRWSRAVASAVLVLCVAAFAQTANAQLDTPAGTKSILRVTETTGLPASRKTQLGLHKGLIVELPLDALDVLVSHPGTVDAVVLTSRRVFILGKELGEANVFFIGRDGQKLLVLDVNVRRDLGELVDMLRLMLPGSRIKVQPTGDGVVLTGNVISPADASRAEEIATQYMKKAPVVNLLQVASKEQVLLKVTVSEMKRDAVKRLGISLPNAVNQAGAFTFAKVIQNGFPASTSVAAAAAFVNGQTAPVVDGAGNAFQASANWGRGQSVTAVLEALERVGLSRTLAEPTLTAISGETAKFLAGGEFPIPVAATNNTVTVSWKQFGVGVGFTPFVIGDGRISLRVAAEVSELSTDGAVTVSNISIPAVSVRRAETVVEMPSGSALAIAGLLSDATRQNVDGVPELRNLPVLGALFRSKDFRASQSELVIVVTPYIVKPTQPVDVARPDDGYAPAPDLQSLFLSNLHRVYGPSHRHNGDLFRGDYGFIVDYPEEGEAG